MCESSSESIAIQIDDDGKRFIEVDMACRSCGTSGVFKGFAEPPGVANVCWTCEGRGGFKQRIYLFDGQKRSRDDIRFVRDGYRESDRIPYAEFLAGKLPNRKG